MTILIVGGGKMGMSHLALATQYVGKPNVALCDSKLSTRLLFSYLGYQTFASVEAAAARLGSLDGVLIATPTSSHASLVRWAISERLPFFVEKPLTLDVAASRELVSMAKAAGIKAQVGFVLRYVASFQFLRRLVDERRLGKVRSYTASMRGNVLTKRPAHNSWQGDFARGGGCLNEYGPHLIDLSCFIFGPVDEIDFAEIDRVFSIRADDKVNADCTHRDTTPGRLEIDWCDSTKRKSVVEFSVRFEHANVRVDNSAVEIDWHEDSQVPLAERSQISAYTAPPNVGFYLRGEEFSLELEDFLGSCLGRNMHVDPTAPTDTTPSLADGYEVDRLIDEIGRKSGLK